MRTGLSRFAGIALSAMLVVILTAGTGHAIWRQYLIEYFDKNQEIPALRWPWYTPPEIPNIRWHYNPQPNWNRHEGRFRTDYCWGVQNFIYNSYIRQREEFPQSIWCAYTNRNLVNEPNWPEDDNYQHNQNAWVWWGPFDTRNAVQAGISFWYYLDVQYGMRDSLTVVLTTNVNNMTINNEAFRSTMAFGWCVNDTGGRQLTKFVRDEQDWKRREFYVDSLRLLDAQGRIVDTVSYLGERTVWVAFVWQSNATGIDVRNGKGAFIDDVILMYDDGLFELQPDRMQFGYPRDEENIDWNGNDPQNNDEVRFRVLWRADGLGEVGPVNIVCILDGNEIYREERTVIAGIDSLYVTEADTLWEVVAGQHTIRWEIDAPADDGGQVEESDERNNVSERTFSVEWNPPPQFTIFTPEADSTPVNVNDDYRVYYTVSDSNETDLSFRIFLFWTADTTGLAENPELIMDDPSYHYMTHTYSSEPGDSFLTWNLSTAFEMEEIDTNQVFYVCGFASDGFRTNQTNSVAPGRIYTRPAPAPDSVDPEENAPVIFGLTRAFPNPFNKSFMIEYSMENAGSIDLAVFDITGRRVETLVSGRVGTGRHFINWSPTGIGAGVYLVRLESAGRTSMQKAIYTP